MRAYKLGAANSMTDTRTTHDGSACSNCGTLLDGSFQECPHCRAQIREQVSPAEDVTPYAQILRSGRRDQPGWQRMCEWVWFASTQRLRHLAPMQASSASRRFANINIFLLAVSVAMSQASRIGWRWVSAVAFVEPTDSTEPIGRVWIHVGGAPRPLPPGQPAEIAVDLWWNPMQSLVAAFSTALVVVTLCLLLLSITGRVADTLHRPPYRGHRRLVSALRYSTAWVVPIVIAGCIAGVRPILYIGRMQQWGGCPTAESAIIPAAVLAGLGLFLWWFWLLRLGAASPAGNRARVTIALGVIAPTLAALAVSGAWMAMDRAYLPLFRMMDLQFGEPYPCHPPPS